MVAEGIFGSRYQEGERPNHAMLDFEVTGAFSGELKVVFWSHRLRLTLTCSDKIKMCLSRFEEVMEHLLSQIVVHMLRGETNDVTPVAENAVLQTHIFEVDKECKSVNLVSVREELSRAGLVASHAPNGKSVLVTEGMSRIIVYSSAAIQVMTRCFSEARDLVGAVAARLVGGMIGNLSYRLTCMGCIFLGCPCSLGSLLLLVGSIGCLHHLVLGHLLGRL